ncbi:growth/differentiation factor 8-like, partial [Anopheles arabiensis]|uniref:growth/differentiation factor 8-like n=1 Tax=Anopheles arabiensis TaxID=7173 RepID=UPI001AAD0AA2
FVCTPTFSYIFSQVVHQIAKLPNCQIPKFNIFKRSTINRNRLPSKKLSCPCSFKCIYTCVRSFSPANTQIPYIEIEFRDAPKKRIKRNLSLNCDENANETRCCRYPLTVDFEKFGWDWIIAPKRYEAWYCAGECMISFLPKYEHTHVMQLSTSAIPCCSPKKMNSIRLLYFDMSYNVIYSTIPNMVVEKCSCS